MQSERLDLPGYEIVEVLGRGGFATVYRAHQLSVDRAVALKVDNRVLSDARDRQRFLREVTAAGRLSTHPHVVAVYDAGVLGDGRPFMVLELCPGGSLGDRLIKHGPFPVREARDIGVRIADALAAAHAAGVLHRDIKPGNILLNQYGGVGLADFGLAAMPRPGHDLSVTREALTPAYAPPEAFRMAHPAPAGDVYSLAATIYALVHGRAPHYPEEGSLSIAEVIVRHSWPLPDLPGVSPAFTEVLRRCMAENPAERLPGAGALRDALAAVVLDAAPSADTTSYPLAPPPPPVDTDTRALPRIPAQRDGSVPHVISPTPPASPPTPPASAARKRRRPQWLIAAVAAVAVMALGTAGALLYQERAQSGDSTTGASGKASSSSSSSSASAVDFQVPTTTEDCPAASVTGTGARCTRTAECWGGMVVITGYVTVTRSDCLAEHVWETFAIAPLPSDGQTINQQELEKNPGVRKVCSREVMAKTRRGAARDIALDKWTVDVLPPSQEQYAGGLRVMRCVAAVPGNSTTAAYFRPRE